MNLTHNIEKFSVLLSVLVLLIACLSFLSNHQISSTMEPRFLVSATTLGLVLIFLRFAIVDIQPLHRALYRVTTVMVIRSVCFYFFPSPNAILYLISAPAFYYLLRIEITKNANHEDMIAVGILLTLSLLLYVQQQPLQVLLFPQAEFVWENYYQHAGLLILIGLTLMRLQKWSNWPDLALLGSVVFLTGLTLSGSYLTEFWLKEIREPVFITLSCHLCLLILFTTNVIRNGFIQIAGLTKRHFLQIKKQVYYLVLLCLASNILYMLFFSASHAVEIPLILLSFSVILYKNIQQTLSIFLIACSLIVFPAIHFKYPALSSLGLIILSTILALSVFLRRRSHLQTFMPDITVAFLLLIFILNLSQNNPFNLLGLLNFAFIFICWIAIPDRPFAVNRQHQLLIWPVLTLISLLCLQQGFQPRIINFWAISCLIPPVIFFILMQVSRIQSLVIGFHWLIVLDWAKSCHDNLQHLLVLSIGLCITSFVLNYSLLLDSWYFSLEILSVLMIAIGLSLYYTLHYRSTRYALQTEILLWITLALIRWKMETTEYLSLGDAIDGYILMLFGGIAAGIREVVNRYSTKFEHYFRRNIFIYSLIGWLTILFTQTSDELAFHGELASVYMTLLYFWLSHKTQKSNLLLTFIFGNTAILLYFYHHGMNNPQFYILPVVGSCLVLSQLFKDKLNHNQLTKIRLICSLIILGTSSFYNILEFQESIWFLVSATFIALLAIIVGISLRIRIYLYLGGGAFLLNLIGIIAQLIIQQPPEHIKLSIGILFLVTGLLFTASFLLFQMKRQEIIKQYHHLRSTVAEWE
ncbi:MAG: hypothetical protein HON94_13500 [Methylococcales bacterium]|nr:hypothetical protein [Methylococcales bacterium]